MKFLFLLFIFSFNAFGAGYDGLDWGSKIEVAKSKYAKHHIEIVNNKKTTLHTIVEAGGRSNVMASLSYIDKKLIDVTLSFPEAGDIPNIINGEHNQPSLKASKKLSVELLNALKIKYGPISDTKVIEGNTIYHWQHNDTYILQMVQLLSRAKAGLVIGYSPVKEFQGENRNKKLTDGL